MAEVKCMDQIISDKGVKADPEYIKGILKSLLLIQK